MRQLLQRMFWTLYGNFVWDHEHVNKRETQIKHVVKVLTERRTSLSERVLDAGCGTGNYAIALAEVNFCVTGIDYASGMLVRAQTKVTETLSQRLTFQPMDLNQQLALPDSSFDHVLNVSVLQNLADPLLVLGELWRVLKPGGTLLLLHVPRSQSQTMPLRDAIWHRVAKLGKRTIGNMVLVAVKTIAERTGVIKYWTVSELKTMLQINYFDVVAVECESPIIIIAEKVKADNSRVLHRSTYNNAGATDGIESLVVMQG